MRIVWAFLLAALASCSHAAAPAVEPSSSALPWCVRVTVQGDQGGPYVLATCAERLETCERLRELARQRGGMVGIRGVGECR